MTSALLSLPPGLRRRRRLATFVAGGSILLVSLGMLTFGDAGFSPAEAFTALWGVGDPGAVKVVQEWRLPRTVLALAVGAMLALSGALFQIVTRNPLGSPDILGFSSGAMTGVLLIMAAGSVTVVGLTLSAFAGGLVAAVLVFALSARRGVRGYAVVVVGIGVTAMIGAVNTVLVIRADDLIARAAGVWATGSLNGVDRSWVAPALIALVVGSLAAAWIAPALHTQEFGEDRSASLGARPLATRWIAMVLGVALLSVATAVTGPISFVALAAPQIARRVWRTGTIPLTASAATGALLLAGCDLIAMRALAPTMLPTGIVTLCIGGVYLAWMLTRRSRSTS